MKHLLVIISVFLFKSTDKPYCTCLPLTIEEKINGAEIIFEGKALTIDTILSVQKTDIYNDDGSKKEYLRPIEMTRTKFEVIKKIKGKEKSDFISIYSTLRCCMCGFTFWKNSTYIVYANSEYITVSTEKEITWDQQKLSRLQLDTTKKFSTTTCTGTEEYNKKTFEEVIKIQKIKNSG